MQLTTKKDNNGIFETKLEWQGNEPTEHLGIVLEAIFGNVINSNVVTEQEEQEDWSEWENEEENLSGIDGLLKKAEYYASLGEPTYGKKLPLTLDEFYQVYQKPYSVEKIAQVIDCNAQTMYKALRENGYILRGKDNRLQGDSANRPLSLYIIGHIIGKPYEDEGEK